MNRPQLRSPSPARSRRSRGRLALERLEARCLMAGDGGLDPTFSGDGYTTIDFRSTDYPHAVALQPDPANPDRSKIIVVGESRDKKGIADSAIARLNFDGALDTTFAGGGKSIVPLSSTDDKLFGVAVDAGRSIFATGASYLPNSNYSSVLVAKFTPDGALDASFGTSGRVVTTIPGQTTSAGWVIKPLPNDGGILVSGVFLINNTRDFLVLRYDARGNLDQSFGNRGIFQLDLGAGLGETARDIEPHLDDAGKLQSITVFGSVNTRDTADWLTNQVSSDTFALLRLTPDGHLDSNFSGDGIALTSFNGPVGSATGLAITTDPLGRLIATGQVTRTSGDTAAVVLAFDPATGTLDQNFASNDGEYPYNGVNIVPLSKSRGRDVAVDSQGRIIVAGSRDTGVRVKGSNTLTKQEVFLARLLPTGGLDPSFDYDGMTSSNLCGNAQGNLHPGDNLIPGLALQGDRIVTVMETDINGSPDFLVARFWNSYPTTTKVLATSSIAGSTLTAPSTASLQRTSTSSSSTDLAVDAALGRADFTDRLLLGRRQKRSVRAPV